MQDQQDLFARYAADELTPAESLQWLDTIGQDASPLPGQLDALLRDPAFAGTPDAAQEERLFRQMMALDKAQQPVRTLYPVRRASWWAAAALLLMAGAGTYWWMQQSHTTKPAMVATIDAAPGRTGAVLTLSNGQQLTLDTMHAGTIARQPGAALQLQNGQLAYDQGGDANNAIAYNTLSTARGRTFTIVLPDGTRAWLNAASSIRYPTAFQGKERRVEVSGEVYFEVAANAAQPFRVAVNEQTSIDVLGTHFNVSAYPGEMLKTTLAEGAIRVHHGSNSVVLAPGQQANINNQNNQIDLIAQANVQQATAWKDGLFNFQDMPFDEVMRQLARWYDITVVYENGIPDVKFDGELGRDVSLSKILFFLSKVDVHYRIADGKKLIITR